MTNLTSLQQVSVNVHDLPRAVSYYKEKLGVRHLFDAGPRMSFFVCDMGVRLMLAIPEKPEFDHKSSILYFKVEDIAAAHRDLAGRARGVPRAAPRGGAAAGLGGVDGVLRRQRGQPARDHHREGGRLGGSEAGQEQGRRRTRVSEGRSGPPAACRPPAASAVSSGCARAADTTRSAGARRAWSGAPAAARSARSCVERATSSMRRCASARAPSIMA